MVQKARGQYDEAEALFTRALEVDEVGAERERERLRLTCVGWKE